MIKENRCIDCGKEIYDNRRSPRCASCGAKFRWANTPKSPQKVCKICGINVSKRSKTLLCGQCAQKEYYRLHLVAEMM